MQVISEIWKTNENKNRNIISVLLPDIFSPNTLMLLRCDTDSRFYQWRGWGSHPAPTLLWQRGDQCCFSHFTSPPGASVSDFGSFLCHLSALEGTDSPFTINLVFFTLLPLCWFQVISALTISLQQRFELTSMHDRYYETGYLKYTSETGGQP